MKSIVVIGVTGGVGTGKSTVAKMFGELGAAVIDADAIVHELIRPKRAAWQRIVKAFGQNMLNTDQTINRQRLAALVFDGATARARLEAIVHPAVRRAMTRRLRALRRAGRVPAVVLDIPLLFETGAQRLADFVVVVTAPVITQQRRVRQAHGWSAQEIRARRRAQWTLAAKAALADELVDNGNGVEKTRAQVKRLWNRRVRDNR